MSLPTAACPKIFSRSVIHVRYETDMEHRACLLLCFQCEKDCAAKCFLAGIPNGDLSIPLKGTGFYSSKGRYVIFSIFNHYWLEQLEPKNEAYIRNLREFYLAVLSEI